MVIKVGVLELQGDFELHHRILKNMGVDSSSVKKSSHLDKLDGLIIPGGESTTMSLLIDNFNMHDALVEFGLVNPVMGTCAGLIIMARNVDDARIKPLGLVDIAVKRNAYGRQIRSVTESIQFNFSEMDKRILPTTFIRAPEITNINEDFKIIGTYKESPVAILAGHCLCLTFHPELDQIDIFHKILFDSSSEVYFKKLDQNYAA
ncbi:MAG: pyridoxal 5'-phosphate synthase glutaminase subunit PdxT [Candidatus Marinimicrobia bacterium]|nr:pyridoxal 5'-phosphate synthase glutaminase subunit PdxT [Candidatus Neomarinimicrobiota bacterium]